MSSQPTHTLKPDGQFVPGLSNTIARKQNVALTKSLKITAIYFIFGSLWIILTDSLTKNVYGGPSIVFSISVGKGLLYVLLTGALIFSLVYPALKKIVDSEDDLKKVNEELETSNTELRLANEKSEKSETALLEAQKLAHIGSFEYDRISEILTCTDEVFSICGIEREGFSGSVEAIGQYIHPEDMEHVIRLTEQAISQNRAVQFDCRLIKPDGEERTTNVWITPVFDGSGMCIKNVGTIQDITETKRHFDQIQYMYDHDYPTNLYNRRYFENAKNEMDKEENYPLSIVLTDINGVRLINDAFGTDAGDQMIIKTGEILKSCCREGDVLARIGGDDFSILMPNAGQEEANQMLLAIKNACEEFNSSIEDKTQVINLSMGYGVKTNKETRLAQTEKEAEAYLSRRKLLEQKSHHNAVLSSIMATMYERSFETEEHAQRIAKISRMIGKKMNLSQAKLDELRLFAMLHDIGKIGVSDQILNKPGKLTAEEWPEMKKHPEIGYRIAMSSIGFSTIAEYILTHHERWDGTGYPNGLKGEEIPLLSRILAIADAYDAMTEDRVYRKALTHDEAIEEIRVNAGTQFDPEFVKIFVENI